jgi:hypothetical protein
MEKKAGEKRRRERRREKYLMKLQGLTRGTLHMR